MFPVQLHFFVICESKFRRDSPLGLRLAFGMECVGLIVCRLTITFVESLRRILVIDAECICGLLIYILVKSTPVDICHPTYMFLY